MSSDTSTENDCGCCEGLALATPAQIANDHGLQALRYRIGTHGLFKASMRSGLSNAHALNGLTVRDDDDATMALIDAWATILDVLTFYNERIINEGYLSTSKERLSLVELAKHIGYIPKPGVAAGAWFSFLMSESPGAPLEAKVPVGTRVQSIPRQDEKAQTFETIEKIIARTAWNTIRPKLTVNQVFSRGLTSLYLEGTNAQIQVGDKILLVGSHRLLNPESERWDFRTVNQVTLFPAENLTQISWKKGLGHDHPLVHPADDARVFVFRQRAALFGHNAPDFRTMSKEIKESFCQDSNNTKIDDNCVTVSEWKDFEITDDTTSIYLDALYPKILTDSWLVFVRSDHAELYKVNGVKTSFQVNFTLTTKSSEIEPDTTENLSTFQRRETVVWAQSEELPLAKAPNFNTVSGKNISLDKAYPGLQKGQKLIIQGKLAEEANTSLDKEATISELVEIESYSTMSLVLKEPLAHRYNRATVTINANIARGTHGETKMEILGSGNAAIPFQKFYLKQKPLTYISSASAKGIATSLEVRVDGILWKKVSTFHNRTSEERIYISRIEDDGTTYIRFGNGITGARLPLGVENVLATYRVGIGVEGIVKADQLSLLMSPQLGIKSVTNPLPTSGAENPESLESIAHNAPLTVVTLDRIVSIEDYEYFAHAFAGIGKARADLLWKGENRTVHLTLASANQSSIESILKAHLKKAINEARHTNYPVIISSYKSTYFDIKARIKAHPDYLFDTVVIQVKEALGTAYGFEARTFGQGVTPSELIAVIQSVEGVIAVDLDELGGRNPFSTAHFRLTAKIARWNQETGKALPAELLLIHPDGILITPMIS